MKLVEFEIQRQDWASIRCGCGESAEHVGPELLRIARGEAEGLNGLEGHVFMPSVAFEPALPAVSVALAALADTVGASVREVFAHLLLQILASEGQSIEAARAGMDLLQGCRVVAEGGRWLLYSEVIRGATVDGASYLFEALGLLEGDLDRLDAIREIASDNLRWDLKLSAAD